MRVGLYESPSTARWENDNGLITVPDRRPMSMSYQTLRYRKEASLLAPEDVKMGVIRPWQV